MSFGIGVIGCGNISKQYGKTLAAAPDAEIVAAADLDADRAAAFAHEFGVPNACGVEALLARDDVHAVVNLTLPAAHAEVCERVIEAGKHCFVEKPLAARFADGERLLELSRERGVRLGCAPDTVLGPGVQALRAVFDDAGAGPVHAVALSMLCPGHEHWHPSPGFYYEPGGGPLFDMGPYYLTAAVHLVGPLERVFARAVTPRTHRRVTSEPLRGTLVPVLTRTHIEALLTAKSGAVVTLTMSFDAAGTRRPPIEVHALERSAEGCDPNGFASMSRWRPRYGEWRETELSSGSGYDGRGSGLLEMLRACARGVPHRCSAEIGLHVLEVCERVLESAERGVPMDLRTTCERPEPVSGVSF